MKRIYLSYFLGADTPFYGGNKSFQVEGLRSISSGDTCNTSRWAFPNHAGTHVDLPRHFVIDGLSLEEFSPDFWIFQHIAIAELVDIAPDSVVGQDMLKHFDLPPDTELLLIKTGFGRLRETPSYWMNSPIFLPELAEYLRERFPNLRAIGFDSISLSSWSNRTTGRCAHHAFLGGKYPILLIEDMDLSLIDNSSIVSKVTVAPLLVRSADAAPCTIIAEVVDQ